MNFHRICSETEGLTVQILLPGSEFSRFQTGYTTFCVKSNKSGMLI
uniref:Major sperm protein n=1 Tax=Parascaris univalens TaxID=6257 RepID=A0A915B953_PARUN